MEAESKKWERSTAKQHPKISADARKVVLPLMMLDIRLDTENEIICYFMLMDKWVEYEKERRCVHKSWLNYREVSQQFTKKITKTLLHEYERSCLQLLSTEESQAPNPKTALFGWKSHQPSETLNWVFDRIGLIRTLRGLLKIPQKLDPTKQFRRSKKDTKLSKVIGKSRSTQTQIDTNIQPLESLDLGHFQQLSSLPPVSSDAQNLSLPQHNDWKATQAHNQQKLQICRTERVARHASRWEVKDVKVFLCRVERRQRKANQKPNKTKKIQLCKKVVTLKKEQQQQLQQLKQKLVEDFSNTLVSHFGDKRHSSGTIKVSQVESVVKQFIREHC